MPSNELPVLIAARLSLSFPILLSAVRLLTPHPNGDRMVENWMSDGGITSNFPIHFFDRWLPRHPTFGLDLQPYPDKLSTTKQDMGGRWHVHMPPDPRTLRDPRWSGVAGVTVFLRQIKDAMQNWRDVTQAELPGYRDRICEIRLGSKEGGLNLNMGPETITSLVARGRLAGETVDDTFRWNVHAATRYLTFMEMMQMGLHDAREPFERFGPVLCEGFPDDHPWRAGHNVEWCRLPKARRGACCASPPRGPSGPLPDS
jgi:hypothetical protein